MSIPDHHSIERIFRLMTLERPEFNNFKRSYNSTGRGTLTYSLSLRLLTPWPMLHKSLFLC